MKDLFYFITKGFYKTDKYDFFESLKIVLFGYFKVLFAFILILTFFSLLGMLEKNSPVIKRDDIPLYFKLLFGCLIMPILEELIFRLPLNPKKINVLSSIFLFSIFIFFITKKFFINFEYKYLLLIIITVITLYLSYLKINFLLDFIQNHFFLVVHVSTISFCLFHYGNYNFKNSSILPYLIMFSVLLNGYYFAYTRLRFGIFYAIFIHSFHNILVSLPLFIKLLK